MIWDLSILRFPALYRSVADVPPDAQCLDIGQLSTLRAAISAVFAGVDWTDPARGFFRCPSGSVEFAIGTEQPVRDFTMHVRAGLDVAPLLSELCRRNGWSVLDSVAGEFLPRPNASAADFESQQRYETRLGSPLGVYPAREGYVKQEYQIGRRLIWVMCRSGDAESECLQRADEMLGAALACIPAALALAEDTSRNRFPSIWAMHDWSGVVGQRLDVWGVTLTPDKRTIGYEISRNWSFDFGAIDADSSDIESHYFYVDRSPSGDLHVREA